MGDTGQRVEDREQPNTYSMIEVLMEVRDIRQQRKHERERARATAREKRDEEVHSRPTGTAAETATWTHLVHGVEELVDERLSQEERVVRK